MESSSRDTSMDIDQETQLQIPRDGKVLLPHVVDILAKCKPHEVHAEYPASSFSYKAGYLKVTYSDLANAVNGIAWWLQKTLGPGNFEKLAYIGPNDLRYPVLVLGAIKAGYVMFLPSPRNSIVAQISLFKKLKCSIILVTDPHLPPTMAIIEAIELHKLEVPSVSQLLDIEYPPFDYTKTYEEAYLEPIFIVHTSGSTGIPKPIIYTHETGARNMAMMLLDPPDTFESQTRLYTGKRVFITFPPFHGAYLDIYLFNAIPFGTVMIMPTSGPVSAAGVVEGLKRTPAEVAFIVPSIVQEISQDPELLNYCTRNLETLIYSGGDLPQATGDTVASKIKLINLYGSLELGIIALLQPKAYDVNDWKYVIFHPHIGVDLRCISDDIYGLYITHKPAQDAVQPTSSLFPNAEEFSSQDLFIGHPKKPHLWRWYARADDIIVFSNGEKTNPISMEQHIMVRNPDEVHTALVMGSQRFQAALLIDPTTPLEPVASDDKSLRHRSKAETDLLDKIWPSIEEANKDSPAHARIMKTHVFFTKPEKKVLIAGKGTVQRAGTLALYKDELEALYSAADETSAVENSPSSRSGVIDLSNPLELAQAVRKVILSVTGWRTVGNQDDFFTQGLDSIQGLVIMQQLRRASGLRTLPTGTIYQHPSISVLSSAINELGCRRGEVMQITDSEIQYRVRYEILQEYRGKIDQMATSRHKVTVDTVPEELAGHVVLLTGSTGALGSYILADLLSNSEVTHIYCLNRSSKSLQVERNLARNLPIEFPASRVTFLTCDLSRSNLGLPPHIYDRLLKKVTRIIHNAWPVNFNLSLASFKPHITGLVNLLELAVSSSGCHSVRFFFVSSISSVMYFRSQSSKTPECVIQDDTAPGRHGYAESKYISELLIGYAGEKLGIDLAFARLGQIAGAVQNKGVWLRNEWFPSLLISSLYLGEVPRDLGSIVDVIDWIPIDLLAGILSELALSYGSDSKHAPISDRDDSEATSVARPSSLSYTRTSDVQVFHPLNPHVLRWNDACLIFVEALAKLSGTKLKIVDSDAWLERVKNDIEVKDNETMGVKLRRNPVFILLDFYRITMRTRAESANTLDMTKTMAKSAKLRELQGVNPGWIWKWAEQIHSMV
ncbi:Non-canonical non-ribosomal peptide synthetase FUB8 [Lachnellula arida]|uniref:Non-canonical non-ribosomal peptide synthetase FUB8 n=1 Tax=Lachnellula arida TaxID=1316785 RepID=A0A8T9BER1_9HELO|nr:Non-canonical non-ribosomal peptide synthetase FUB8 [Lachnellula arida]